MRRRITLADKKKFLEDHEILAEQWFRWKSERHRDLLVACARDRLGYSRKTVDVDILSGLRIAYGHRPRIFKGAL